MLKKIFLLLIFFAFLIFPKKSFSAGTIEECPYGIVYGGGGTPDNSTSNEVFDYLLGKIKESGVCWVRFWMLWYDIERTKGVYTWDKYDYFLRKAHDLNLKIMVVIDKAPNFYSIEPVLSPAPTPSQPDLCPPADNVAFENFVRAATNRYKDYVSVWQIENESFGKPCFLRHPERYPSMFNSAASIIKSIAPNTKVATAGISYAASIDGTISSWLSLTKNSFDIVAVHAHRRNDSEVGDVINTVKSILGRIDSAQLNKPMFITETSFDLRDNSLSTFPYEGTNFKNRINYITDRVNKVFWFKHINGTWGPGIVEDKVVGSPVTPLFGLYNSLIKEKGWFFPSPTPKPSIDDLLSILRNWGKSGQGDVNGDGKVNGFDFSFILKSL